MFIDFAGMIINTNYIISIYKTSGLKKYYEVNIRLYSDNIIKELYDTEEERDKRFNEIIDDINNKT